jgi:hypothetical protein
VSDSDRGRELRDIQIDQDAPIRHCESCGALIWWGFTATRKRNPFDVIDGARTAVTHFSTCPQAREWSRR